MAIRKIKAHKKSRRGCGNCKLRKVKCDETHPECTKCISHGLSCNFQSGVAALEVSLGKPMDVLVKLPTPPPFRYPILSGDDMPSYHMRASDMLLMTKYQERTIYTMSTENNRHLLGTDVAFPHSYIVHAMLCIASMHDRSLSGSNSQLTQTERFHLCRASRSFNKKLSDPVQPSDRDALIVGSWVLGMLSFVQIDAEGPEEAWPLKPPSSMDLNWLKIGEGKKAVLRLTETVNREPSYGPPRALRIPSPPPLSDPSTFASLPQDFISFYSLNATSTVENNPYHAAAHSLARISNAEDMIPIAVSFMSFIVDIPPAYKQLLEKRDSRALLLMAYWHAKVSQLPIWWITPRTTLECQAICLYLKRYHQHEPTIQSLLEYPRSVVFGSSRAMSVDRMASPQPGSVMEGSTAQLHPR